MTRGIADEFSFSHRAAPAIGRTAPTCSLSVTERILLAGRIALVDGIPFLRAQKQLDEFLRSQTVD